MDADSIDKQEEEYFDKLNKKGVFMSMGLDSNIDFHGFESSFAIKEELLDVVERKPSPNNIVIKSTTLDGDNKKSLL